jgi:hypothetical protein
MLEKERDYSIKPENLNLDEYKNPLLNKLKDSLEIAGFDVAVLERGLFEHNTISHMTMPSRGVAGNMISCIVSGVNQVARRNGLGGDLKRGMANW